VVTCKPSRSRMQARSTRSSSGLAPARFRRKRQSVPRSLQPAAMCSRLSASDHIRPACAPPPHGGRRADWMRATRTRWHRRTRSELREQGLRSPRLRNQSAAWIRTSSYGSTERLCQSISAGYTESDIDKLYQSMSVGSVDPYVLVRAHSVGGAQSGARLGRAHSTLWGARIEGMLSTRLGTTETRRDSARNRRPSLCGTAVRVSVEPLSESLWCSPLGTTETRTADSGAVALACRALR
jgi:hypothetical protein